MGRASMSLAYKSARLASQKVVWDLSELVIVRDRLNRGHLVPRVLAPHLATCYNPRATRALPPR